METIVAAGPGALLMIAGVIGLAVTVAVRFAWQGIHYERLAVLERELAVERRERAIAEQERAVAEFEGRLMQVAECGCCLANRSCQVGREAG